MSKKVKNHNLKDKLFKILHVICYILSALFIVISIIAGVKSCEKKTTSVSAETEYSLKINKNKLLNFDDSYYLYTFKFQNLERFEIPKSVQYQISDPYMQSIFDNYYLDNQSPYYMDINVDFSNAYALLSNGNVVKIDSLGLTYITQSEELNTYRWVLGGCWFYFNSSFTGFFQREYQNWDSVDNYVFYEYLPKIDIYIDNKVNNNAFFDYFFELSQPSKIIFNKQWNYNSFLGTNLSGLYGSASFDSDGENMRYKNFNTGFFISNGQVFNQIQVWAIQSAGNTVLSNGQSTSLGLMPAPSGYWIYSFAYYRNTSTNYEILVNYHDTVPFSSGDVTSRYYANSSTWVNDAYRYITFLEPLNDNLRITLNAFNNNNQSYFGGAIYNDGYDVFTLLSFAFTSLSDFWSLSILPGITIGVLFFLPAVVGIIITIVHILRK